MKQPTSPQDNSISAQPGPEDEITTRRVSARRSFLSNLGPLLLGAGAMSYSIGAARAADKDYFTRPADSKLKDLDKGRNRDPKERDSDKAVKGDAKS
jgi:hypothetical protein